MEITSSMIYWLTRLGALNGLFIGISVTTGVTALGLFISGLIEYDCGDDEIAAQRIKKAVRLTIITFLPVAAACFVPTTKQAAAIIVIPKIANNEQVQELPNKILELGNEWLNELRPEK